MHTAARPEGAAAALAAVLAARQTVLPRRLGAPGPDAAQLQAILGAARHAPDHGGLLPWRLTLVPEAARAALGEAFVQALHERDPHADAEAQARARDKAARAPVLLLVTVDESPDLAGHSASPVPPAERVLSAGCAVQNVLLMATALGYGGALTSGQALQSHALRALFALAPAERAVCFLSLGSVIAARPPRERPAPSRYLRTLVPGLGVQPLDL